jgi:hypothetical protein
MRLAVLGATGSVGREFVSQALAAGHQVTALVRGRLEHGEMDHRMGEQEEFGNAGLVVAHDLFDAWEQFRQDGVRAALQARIAPLQTKLRAELEHASRKSTKTKHRRQFARNLNNHAERGLRGAVIYRKLSLGSQSERGERSLERLLSASITCRLRKRSLFGYLTDVTTAHARRDPIPALS